jgi:hypothetical protein
VITEVSALRYEGKIVGIRAFMGSGSAYDVDLHIFEKKLQLDPSKLRFIDLLEFNDMLISEEEFDTGVFVEEASDNPRILKSVKDYIDSQNENSPLMKAKLFAKKKEIRQKYFSYVPKEWETEFVDYHLDHFESNSNIYEGLTNKQHSLIKTYFRWRSKLLFEEKNAPRILRSNPTKSQTLANLMGNATDWIYDGTVDTGVVGGGHCELGHALRYAHFAASASLGKAIIFGSKCMSDFFEVDQAVLKEIMSAQEFLLKEIKVIVFILNTGKLDEFKTRYSDMWSTLQSLNGNFNKIKRHGSGWVKFMSDFDKAGLPLTRSLLSTYTSFAYKLKDGELDRIIDREERQGSSDSDTSKPAVTEDGYDLKNLDLIEQGAKDGKLSERHFSLVIIPTIRKTNRISEKQRRFLDEALDIINKA